MKWTKSIIGEIGFIDTKNGFCYKEAIKKIPNNARIMKSWEYLKLIDEDFKSLKNIPKYKHYFAYATEKYYRASRVGDFDFDLRFDGDDWSVGDSLVALRGVLVVKEGETQ